MTEQELVQFLMQYYPEWSVSEQEYQPTDIGSMNANMDLLKDESGLIKDWVMGFLTNSFDYGGLQGAQAPFEEVAPSNALSQKYRDATDETGALANAKLFEALDAGMTAQQAAQVAWGEGKTKEEVEELGTMINENKPLPGNYKLMLDMATSVEQEVAEYAAWEQRRDAHIAAAPVELNDLQKELQAAGLYTGVTPDEWYANQRGKSIEGDREAYAVAEAELAQIMAANESLPDRWEEGSSSLPMNAPTPAPRIASVSETDFADTPQAEAYVREMVDQGVSPDWAAEAVTRPDAELNMELYGQPYAPNQNARWISWDGFDGVGNFIGDLFSSDGGGGGGGAEDHPRNNSAAARIAQGVDQEMLADARAGRSLGEMLGGSAPRLGAAVPSQNMQVPFDPESHYAPSNTLPDFNGPRGGSPRNGTPSNSGPAAFVGPTMAEAEKEYNARRKKQYDAEWAEGAARWNLKFNEMAVNSARNRGESIQQKQLLDRLFGLPRPR